jgi:hypothetical protein
VRAVPEGTTKEDCGISCLTWSADGGRLLFGAQDGAAGVLDLPGA